MIKKNTTAIFRDGELKGTHDWKGGMPLTKGEILKVHLKDPERTIEYVLDQKTMDCFVDGEDQMVEVVYHFKKIITS